jgi:hypothetical protein
MALGILVGYVSFSTVLGTICWWMTPEEGAFDAYRYAFCGVALLVLGIAGLFAGVAVAIS